MEDGFIQYQVIPAGAVGISDCERCLKKHLVPCTFRLDSTGNKKRCHSCKTDKSKPKCSSMTERPILPSAAPDAIQVVSVPNDASSSEPKSKSPSLGPAAALPSSSTSTPYSSTSAINGTYIPAQSSRSPTAGKTDDEHEEDELLDEAGVSAAAVLVSTPSDKSLGKRNADLHDGPFEDEKPAAKMARTDSERAHYPSHNTILSPPTTNSVSLNAVPPPLPAPLIRQSITPLLPHPTPSLLRQPIPSGLTSPAGQAVRQPSIPQPRGVVPSRAVSIVKPSINGDSRTINVDDLQNILRNPLLLRLTLLFDAILSFPERRAKFLTRDPSLVVKNWKTTIALFDSPRLAEPLNEREQDCCSPDQVARLVRNVMLFRLAKEFIQPVLVDLEEKERHVLERLDDAQIGELVRIWSVLFS